jgi:uncharacterized protein (TIGR02117 family)
MTVRNVMCLSIRAVLALACGLIVAGCATPAAPMFGEPRTRAIQIVGHGWHTGLAIARADLPEDFPALDAFAAAEQLEFGWGDAAYYPAQQLSVWLGVRALFWPTPSVLHVAAIGGDVPASFPASTIVRIALSAEGLQRLLEFIRAEFVLDPQGQPVAVARGLYGDSHFYRARGKFHFPRTCNWWIARALVAGGVPIEPATAITAGALLSQAARHGQVVQRR